MQHRPPLFQLVVLLAAGWLTLLPSAQAETPKDFDLKDPDYWAEQCRSFANQQQYTEALAACEKAITLNPNPKKPDLELWKVRGSTLFNLGRFRDTIASFDYVLQRQPKSSIGLVYRCRSLLQLGQSEDALTACEQALTIDGDWSTLSPGFAWYGRGLVLRKMGQIDAALESYERAIAANPTDLLAKAERCETFAATGRYTPAIAECDSVMKAPTWSAQTPALAWYKRGLTFQHLRQYASAKPAFEQAATLYERLLGNNPNDAFTWTAQGIVLEALRQDDRALTSYDRAIQLNPTYALALASRCTVLNRMEQYATALIACDAALKGDEIWGERSSAFAWNQRSGALLGLKQYPAAIAAAERAIALEETAAEAWNNKAVGLWHLQQYAAAETAARTATQLKPQYAYGSFSLGRIFSTQAAIAPTRSSQTTFYAAAVAAYDQALAGNLQPDDRVLRSEILTNKAAVLWQMGQATQAVPSAQQATEENPRSFAAWFNLGIVLTANQRYSRAVQAFDQANQLVPNNLYVLTGRGAAYFKSGNLEAARQDLEAALDVKADYAPAQAELKQVMEAIVRRLKRPTPTQP
jgi:tetratricopeptide (TPR) repeat protein